MKGDEAVQRKRVFTLMRKVMFSKSPLSSSLPALPKRVLKTKMVEWKEG